MTALKLVVATAFLALQAQWVQVQAAQFDWEASARQADESYWNAYNNVDPQGMNAMLADDVEFYHDRGGKILGKKALAATNEGMKKAEHKLRREAVPGTVRFFPMRKGDDVYGVMVTGEHRFYVLPKGQPEFLVGRAYFTQLMQLKGNAWKISRIFSYEHVDAEQASQGKL